MILLMQFSRVAWESSTLIFVNFANVFFQQGLIVFTQKYFNGIFFLKFYIAMQLCLCLILLLFFFFFSCLIRKKVSTTENHLFLNLSRRRPLSYKNQSIDLLRKSMDWFLYDNGLGLEMVK